MAVVMRLKRVGGKNQPCYRIVVADSRSPRDGKFIENLGTYDPVRGSDSVVINAERARYWLERGAQPSNTVGDILRKQKITKS